MVTKKSNKNGRKAFIIKDSIKESFNKKFALSKPNPNTIIPAMDVIKITTPTRDRRMAIKLYHLLYLLNPTSKCFIEE